MFETSDECNRFRSGRFSNRAKLGFSASLTVPMWVRRTLTEEESGRLSRRLKEDLSKNPVKAAEEQTLKADNIKRLIGEVNLVEGKTTDQALIAGAGRGGMNPQILSSPDLSAERQQTLVIGQV
jgi:hypothetical protein